MLKRYFREIAGVFIVFRTLGTQAIGVVNLCEDDRRAIDNVSILGTEIISLGISHKLESVTKKRDTILSPPP